MSVIYLLIVMVGGGGVTSQLIPQSSMSQCQTNAALLTKESSELPNTYLGKIETNKAFCLKGLSQ